MFIDLLSVLSLNNPNLLSLIIFKPLALLHSLAILSHWFSGHLDLSPTNRKPTMSIHEGLSGCTLLNIGWGGCRLIALPQLQPRLSIDYDLLFDLDFFFDPTTMAVLPLDDLFDLADDYFFF